MDAWCFAIHKCTRHQLLDKTMPSPGMGGGPLSSIIEWLVIATVLTLLHNASIIKLSRWGSVFWWI